MESVTLFAVFFIWPSVFFFFFFLCCMCVCSFSLFDKSLLSGAATMLLMLLFLIFHSPLACYNVYRFVASSLFSCCPIILYAFVHIILVLTIRKWKTLTNTTQSSAAPSFRLHGYDDALQPTPLNTSHRHFSLSLSSTELTGLQHQASLTAEEGSTVVSLARFSYISWYHKLKISKQSTIYIWIGNQTI